MAKLTYLEFEKPVSVLEDKIAELQKVSEDPNSINIQSEIDKLERKKTKLLKDIYSKLTPWNVSLVARHPQRPYTLDYINTIFTDFHELHGDRSYADDLSIVGGLARFNGHSVMVIGHQKGRDTKERTLRNFGMSRPEGYRKALRLMKLAEKFNIPLFTFVDTPGAYPGIGAEERGQSEAIGHNLYAAPSSDYYYNHWRRRLRRCSGDCSLRRFTDASEQYVFRDFSRRLRLHSLEECGESPGSGRGFVLDCT